MKLKNLSKKFRSLFIDKKFRKPRIWSNNELRKFAPIFEGSVINVSGWKDGDKQGGLYSEYFSNASEYFISNYPDDKAKGVQNLENEIEIDLEDELSSRLEKRFDVVYNHTVIEHIFDVRKAFHNICKMSKKAVITVVPYIQQLHYDEENFGDFWRFTPLTMKQLYSENGFDLHYCSANGNAKNASIYLFCIGLCTDQYKNKISKKIEIKLDDSKSMTKYNVIGANIIR